MPPPFTLLSHRLDASALSPSVSRIRAVRLGETRSQARVPADDGGHARGNRLDMQLRIRIRHIPIGAAVVVIALTWSIGVAAAASPIVRLSIVHTVHGCHVWVSNKVLGPSVAITVRRGTRLVIRPTCPMDFDVAQVRGPRLKRGNPRIARGSSRVITFTRSGVYRLTAKNVQTSTDVGLQTLGPDNVLVLTIVVR
jgi:hypothetical protein